jgi:hypothetical protein
VATLVAAVATRAPQWTSISAMGDLLHLRVAADVRRFAIASFQQGKTERLSRLLTVVDRALRDGGEGVRTR